MDAVFVGGNLRTDFRLALEPVLAHTAATQFSLTKIWRVPIRLEDNGATDFGAPGVIPSSDYVAPDRAELERYATILGACWQAFDAIAAPAMGVELRKGPRGGGRELLEIVDHVRDVEAAYLGNIGNKWVRDDHSYPIEALRGLRQTVLDTLAVAEGAVLPQCPRGGKRWPWRYYLRRAAWHVLDRAWEIEDRAI